MGWFDVSDGLLVCLWVLNGRDVALASDATGARNRCRNVVKKRSPWLGSKVTNEIWAALNTHSVTLPAEATWRDVISDVAGDLDRVWCQRNEFQTVIEEVFMSYPLGRVLVTLCGFGSRTGAWTLAEIGDRTGRYRITACVLRRVSPVDW